MACSCCFKFKTGFLSLVNKSGNDLVKMKEISRRISTGSAFKKGKGYNHHSIFIIHNQFYGM